MIHVACSSDLVAMEGKGKFLTSENYFVFDALVNLSSHYL